MRRPARIQNALTLIGLHWKYQGMTPPELRRPPPPEVLQAYRQWGVFYGATAGTANKGQKPTKAKLAQLADARSKPRPRARRRDQIAGLASALPATWCLKMPHSPGNQPQTAATAPSSFSFPFLEHALPDDAGAVRIKRNADGQLLARFVRPPGRSIINPPDGFSLVWAPLPHAHFLQLPHLVQIFINRWNSLASSPCRTRSPDSVNRTAMRTPA